MGIMYTGIFKAVAVTAQQDFFELKASAGGSVAIHGFLLSQETEFGDAQEEQLRLTTNRAFGAVSPGSGGNSPDVGITVRPIIRGSPAFGGILKVNDTTKIAAGAGTLDTDLEVHNWNERIPYPFWYTPETRPIIMPGEFWTLELETTPADSVTVSGTLWFEVIGGA